MSATTSSDSTLAAAWSELRRRGRTALIPYLTAGHPALEASLEALRRADEQCDILEVGVPFSDPLADGPTIQRST
ncbi:MAG TPA: tryptophan synthase subunit alpha, partial [Gemmatimonadales bacterium]|nr:tryptophan synthase subunit alpha [Gemmatimonadales bacterium]